MLTRVIRYWSTGTRDYRLRPVPVHARGVWEFMLVHRGAIAPTLDGGSAPVAERHLWILGPGARHGWTGDGRDADIAVLHSEALPVACAGLVPADGWRGIALDDGGLAAALAAVEEAGRGSVLRSRCGDLHAERGLLSLCLLVAERLDAPAALPDPAIGVVHHALAWYAANLDVAPSYAAVARAMHTSQAHLRRLFHRVLGTSPRAAFAALRVRRGQELLASTDLPHRAIASACGWHDEAGFSRSFKRLSGQRPGAWLATRRPG